MTVSLSQKADGISKRGFAQVADFMDKRVSPVAHLLDTDSDALFAMFAEAGEMGLLTPKTPDALGGLGASAARYRHIQYELAQRSGALIFLLTQHQSAASFLLAGENDALKRDYLPRMASGEKRVGVGFSHLRRLKSPVVARPVSGGYQLSGEVPWVTGAGLFKEFVVGATVGKGGVVGQPESVFGLLPLVSDQGKGAIQGGELAVSKPMPLSGMRATNTVSVTLHDYFLPNEWVVGTRPAGWLAGRDRANPLGPIGLIYGCAEAACKTLSGACQRRQIAHPIQQQLEAKVQKLFKPMEEAIALPVEAYDEKVAFRGQAIALMNTCAQAAIIASAGAANGLYHPARRIQGEALVFSVSGQSTEGAIATLDSLLGSAKRSP